MMNVFVLCTGRCGSTTFAQSASHIKNFTSGHETRLHLVGDARLAFPPRHIEADNRLSWTLGRLNRAFGKDAFYVHLTRDPEAVARSYEKRWGTGIIKAYHEGVLLGAQNDRLQVCRDYVETVTTNITSFLADKPNRMQFRLEEAAEHWAMFWEWIGAEGDFEASTAEWTVNHNSSTSRPSWRRRVSKVVNKAQRLSI